LTSPELDRAYRDTKIRVTVSRKATIVVGGWAADLSEPFRQFELKDSDKLVPHFSHSVDDDGSCIHRAPQPFAVIPADVV
jgi:hypothetical protein